MIGPNILVEMKLEMEFIKRNLKETRDIEKSYAYQHREFNELQVGDHVYFYIQEEVLEDWVMCQAVALVL